LTISGDGPGVDYLTIPLDVQVALRERHFDAGRFERAKNGEVQIATGIRGLVDIRNKGEG
jgi:hypothetical protein